jgi:adenine-specific DNA-methyltransferase
VGLGRIGLLQPGFFRSLLKGEYEESVWDHLSGATSAPFEAGEHKQIAVKVIDDRGNELLVVKKLS